MSTLWLTFGAFAAIGSASVAAASVVIEDATQARAYVDRIFTENNCRMSFARVDARMRADGIIPTEAEMQSPTIGVMKFIRQRRVMGALDRLFTTGELRADETDQTIAVSKFGGCA